MWFLLLSSGSDWKGVVVMNLHEMVNGDVIFVSDAFEVAFEDYLNSMYDAGYQWGDNPEINVATNNVWDLFK